MQTVFVGLSGGVDSAVSAYVLKKQGYRVVGAFIQGWEPDFLPCTGVRDRLEAMRVAAHLNIPFVTYNLEEEYKRDVVDYFVEEYRSGKTPNPDVMCNRAIKFGAFWDKIKFDGADFLATGHYAQVENNTDSYSLTVSQDTNKDQTYFLWTLQQSDLAHTLFPIGNLLKDDVRRLALEANLPNAKRPDSQGLCFLGHVDMRAFLKRYIPSITGIVRNSEGKEVGTHDGAWFYTIGQRHGFDAQSPERQYVIAKDVEKNELTIADLQPKDEFKKAYQLERISAVSGEISDGAYMARYRYRQALMPVTYKDGSVLFDTPQHIAEGQSLVLHDLNLKKVIGGGTIQ
ncbi:tRNA 2-thiouridine(34) synthase MnmA [Patescibacteria group bacterium]|nr:MAG: tRNA 2-thiouridine(34) synthase MnmA [Patescibacteria group bacterium]